MGLSISTVMSSPFSVKGTSCKMLFSTIKGATTAAMVLIILCMVVSQGVSDCISGNGCFYANAVRGNNRKALAGLKEKEVPQGTLHRSTSTPKRENFEGRKSRSAPAGPDSYHKKPTTPSSIEVSATTVTFLNKCSHPVWSGIQPNTGKPILALGGGFKLLSNNSYSLNLPSLWSGRFWGRQGCSFDASGHGRCTTGDCGGAVFCNGLGGAPPVTVGEITLGEDRDLSHASFVDGYNNIGMSITPFRGPGKCSYVYDSTNIVATCTGGSYLITFCPHHR